MLRTTVPVHARFFSVSLKPTFTAYLFVSMKKTFASLVLAIALCFSAQAQFTRYVVQLKNKALNTYTVGNHSQFLSARALQRRTRYGIAVDSTDLPVTKRYLDSLASIPDVQVLSTSRWLNQVLIRITNQSALTKINSFPFVQGAAAIAAKSTATGSNGKFTETVTTTTLPITGRVQGGTGVGDTINYGGNYPQIHIHEGEFLHNKGLQGQGMVIAVLDGGFQAYKTIKAFDSVRLQGRILGEKDFVAFDNSVNEDHPHGMQCLSTIAANLPGQMVGSANKASFWLIRTEDVNSEYPIEEFNYIVGTEFADSVGADMISCSLGYYDFDDASFNHTYAQLNGNTIPATIAADMAAKKGMLLTNSAGNEGNTAWMYLTVPSDADSVVCVGAVNSAGLIASFSSRGIPSDPRIKPSVVSMGVSTVIAGTNGPVTGSGTSYATPNLNGLIACLWQAFPAFNNINIMDAVYKSSDRYATPDKTYGYGIPNFKKAYRILKKQQNDALYGLNWLRAVPNPFTDTIRASFIGQKDGTATIQLVNANNVVVAQQMLVIEEQESYTIKFSNLGLHPAGTYTVRYSDGTTTQSVPIIKLGSTFDFSVNWLLVYPIPYRSQLNVTIKSPIAGTATIRLVTALGQILESFTKQATLDEVYSFRFRSATVLSAGPYYVEYNDGTNKTVKKVVKR